MDALKSVATSLVKVLFKVLFLLFPGAHSDALRRDPKDVTDEEYTLLYQATFRDFAGPLAWQHFSGDTGSGVSFKAIIFVPSRL